jgi:hypothetical protein
LNNKLASVNVSSATIAHGNERPWAGVHACLETRVRDVRNLSVNEIHPVTQTGLFTAKLSHAPLVLFFLFLIHSHTLASRSPMRVSNPEIR